MFWLLLLVLAGRGGVGKTLLCSLLTSYLLRLGRPPAVLEYDVQARLAGLFPDITIPVQIDRWAEFGDDPVILARIFSRIPAIARQIAGHGRDQIVDTAAAWHTPTIEYCAEARIAETVAALKGRMVFLLPTTADTESIILMLSTVRAIERLLPTATIVPVRNEFFGAPNLGSPAVLQRFNKGEVRRIVNKYPGIKLPRLSPTLWQILSTHKCRLSTCSAAMRND